MEDKIIEVFKKYSKSVDTEYNVYNCLIEEDWSNIAQELVKLFCQPPVSGSLQDIQEVIEFLQWAFRKIDKGDTPEETVRMLLMHREQIDNIKFDSNDI